MHFVDVEREETGGLLALEASCALFEVVLLLEIVGRTSGPASSVERLLAATDKILILGYFILQVVHLLIISIVLNLGDFDKLILRVGSEF